MKPLLSALLLCCLAATAWGRGGRGLTVSNGRLSAEITIRKATAVVLVSDTTFGQLARLSIVPLGSDSLGKYKTRIDKDSAVVHSVCSSGGVNYRRSFFASAPDSLIAIRLTASRMGALSLRLELTSPEPHRVRASRAQLTMLAHTTEPQARACCIVRLEHDDGQVAASDTALMLTGATTATIYLVARSVLGNTNAAEGRDFVSHTLDDAWHTVNLSYDEFLSRHGEYMMKGEKEKRGIAKWARQALIFP